MKYSKIEVQPPLMAIPMVNVICMDSEKPYEPYSMDGSVEMEIFDQWVKDNQDILTIDDILDIIFNKFTIVGQNVAVPFNTLRLDILDNGILITNDGDKHHLFPSVVKLISSKMKIPSFATLAVREDSASETRLHPSALVIHRKKMSAPIFSHFLKYSKYPYPTDETPEPLTGYRYNVFVEYHMGYDGSYIECKVNAKDLFRVDQGCFNQVYRYIPEDARLRDGLTDVQTYLFAKEVTVVREQRGVLYSKLDNVHFTLDDIFVKVKTADSDLTEITHVNRLETYSDALGHLKVDVRKIGYQIMHADILVARSTDATHTLHAVPDTVTRSILVTKNDIILILSTYDLGEVVEKEYHYHQLDFRNNCILIYPTARKEE